MIDHYARSYEDSHTHQSSTAPCRQPHAERSWTTSPSPGSQQRDLLGSSLSLEHVTGSSTPRASSRSPGCVTCSRELYQARAALTEQAYPNPHRLQPGRPRRPLRRVRQEAAALLRRRRAGFRPFGRTCARWSWQVPRLTGRPSGSTPSTRPPPSFAATSTRTAITRPPLRRGRYGIGARHASLRHSPRHLEEEIFMSTSPERAHYEGLRLRLCATRWRYPRLSLEVPKHPAKGSPMVTILRTGSFWRKAQRAGVTDRVRRRGSRARTCPVLLAAVELVGTR